MMTNKAPVCEECDTEMHEFGCETPDGWKSGWACGSCGWSFDHEDDDQPPTPPVATVHLTSTHEPRPLVVGLTGGIGAGKSTCSAAAIEHGYAVFDVDAVVATIWKDAKWLDTVRGLFGDLGDSPKQAVADLAVTDPSIFDTLYTHMLPHLSNEWYQFVNDHADHGVIVLDAPLLIEKGWSNRCDAVVLVETDIETRRARVLRRPGVTTDLFEAIVKSQWTDAAKAGHADHIIRGDVLIEDMQAAFLDILARYAPKIGVYPGTFDPITRGHLQAVEDSLGLFDEVICLIAYNPSKPPGTFTPDERANLMVWAFQTNPRLWAAYQDGRLKIDQDSGLLVRYCQRVRATHVIRGLRSLTDFDYEQQMHHVNRRLMPHLRTWFIMSDEKYQIVSSSYARALAGFGEDTSWLLTPNVQAALEAKNRRMDA